MSKDRNEADVAFIQALAELLNRNELTELAVKREYGENDRLDVRVSRLAPPALVPAPALPAPAGPAPQATPAARGAEDAADPAQHAGAVLSPMVGTCYLSPEPTADPFVTIGAQVTEGQTLLIIEAMKTMNHIPAPRAGTVKRILVGDGSPVEYGAPLMIVE